MKVISTVGKAIDLSSSKSALEEVNTAFSQGEKGHYTGFHYVFGKEKASKSSFKNPALAIGVFDGVHLGHQYLIKKMVAKAKSLQGTSVVMTFFPHPVQVLQPQTRLPFVISLKHRLKLIYDLGVDICIVIPFTEKFSFLSPEQFIERYLENWVKPKAIFVGEDFRFGQNRSGDLEFFRNEGTRLGFCVNSVPRVALSGVPISSTRIRKLITRGQLQLAARLLGRNVSLLGKVVKGDSRGRTLGFPTANINPDGEVIPPCGVYAVKVIYENKEHYGMTNIGKRPSINNSEDINLEVHIFDFKKNIYGKEIMVEFIKRFRPERKFLHLKLLAAQLKRDEKKAREILAGMTPLLRVVSPSE